MYDTSSVSASGLDAGVEDDGDVDGGCGLSDSVLSQAASISRDMVKINTVIAVNRLRNRVIKVYVLPFSFNYGICHHSLLRTQVRFTMPLPDCPDY